MTALFKVVICKSSAQFGQVLVITNENRRTMCTLRIHTFWHGILAYPCAMRHNGYSAIKN